MNILWKLQFKKKRKVSNRTRVQISKHISHFAHTPIQTVEIYNRIEKKN
jgi:hypothetical protein